ncbi:putative plastid division protein PDV1/PDV2 [Helianthus anomalus]
MDEDGTALVLARASELRSKITNCIQNASSTPDDDAEEADSLLNIRESLEALEAQLSSLQVDLLLFVVHIIEFVENTIDCK